MEITKQSVERSGNLNPMWGKKQSMATRQKISDSQRKRYAAIRKAIREQDILQFAKADDEARKELIHQLFMGHRTKRFFQWSGKMGERL